MRPRHGLPRKWTGSRMRQQKKSMTTRLYGSIFRSPARMSVLAFLGLIGLGTLLLMLPAASTGRPVGLVDALFTATSAGCVTGLVVMDTGSALTAFGQAVVLGLIQAGGLGIMTISTLFLMMAGKRPSLAGRMLVQDTFTQGGRRTLQSILRDVALFTLTFEALGAVFMFFRFLPGRTAGRALYLSVFHSISAFCNAGFSLFSDSFLSYRSDWVLNLTLCLLIISGGIGFLVLSELRRQPSFNRRTWSRMSLHSKLVLSTTIFLIGSGALIILFMERDNTLAALSPGSRLLASLFQSVTARTAGFNTLPVGSLANETLFFLILLMFIGASPGSCGGGIKTSTFATLVTLGISRLRGRERPQLFHRSISQASVGKAVSVVMISSLVVVTAVMALLMTEVGEIPHMAARGRFLELLFEAVSAFGTVGLSTGITGGLSTAGKAIITLVMFVGRLGPLVIAMAVSRPDASRYYYAEENIMIG